MQSVSDLELVSPSTSKGFSDCDDVLCDPGPSSPLGIKESAKIVKKVGTIVSPIKKSPVKVSKPQTARDRERLDVGKQALRELLQDRRLKKKNKTSCVSVLKVYISIGAAILIIGGLFILIFLIPMTIDPALATITYDIDPNPALCLTLSSNVVNPTLEKTWCSCSEGCTKEIYHCQQIIVAYRKGFLQLNRKLQLGFNITAFEIENKNVANSIVDDSDTNSLSSRRGNCESEDWVFDESCWNFLNASLLVNIKGCGYPPNVNCSRFLVSYNTTGRRFLCYYSRLDPSIVITNFDPAKPLDDLILSLGWTCGSQILGAIILIALHCPFRSAWKSTKTKPSKQKYDVRRQEKLV